jgi:hypothetical protein
MWFLNGMLSDYLIYNMFIHNYIVIDFNILMIINIIRLNWFMTSKEGKGK